MSGPRPALTLILLLVAAGLVLAGGGWLARREVEDRVPADRALLRETAAGLQEELARLDGLFLEHLRNLARLAGSEVPQEELRKAAAAVKGPALLAVLPRQGGRGMAVTVDRTGSIPPEPEWMTGNRRPASPFALGVPVEAVSAGESGEGWVLRPGGEWLAWWRRLEGRWEIEGEMKAAGLSSGPPGRTVVIVIRTAVVTEAVERALQEVLGHAWAPVRAAGGLNAVERSGGGSLTGEPEAEARSRPGDLVLPLTSRLGNWQIVSWDRRVRRTEFDGLTLAVAGALASGLAVLGTVTAAAQRRALRGAMQRVSFVNRVSHELNVPLTNLRLSLDLAVEALEAQAQEQEDAGEEEAWSETPDTVETDTVADLDPDPRPGRDSGGIPGGDQDRRTIVNGRRPLEDGRLPGNRRPPPGLHPAIRHRLAVALEETERLGRLVRNVLAFARHERGEPEPLRARPCVPATVVRQAEEQFAPALARRGITLEMILPEEAFGAVLDADALMRITVNLLSNVEKYAASGGWAGVALGKADGKLRLTVSDHGPGIPVEAVERVFLPFERLDSRITEGVSGTGLGLAIARELAGRMGGTLVLKPVAERGTGEGGGGRPGRRPGAVFELVVPLEPERRTEENPGAPSPQAPAPVPEEAGARKPEGLPKKEYDADGPAADGGISSPAPP